MTKTDLVGGAPAPLAPGDLRRSRLLDEDAAPADRRGAIAVIRDGRLIRIHPDDLKRYIQQRRHG